MDESKSLLTHADDDFHWRTRFIGLQMASERGEDTIALNGTRMDGNKVTIKAMSLLSKTFCNFHAKMQAGFDSEIARPKSKTILARLSQPFQKLLMDAVEPAVAKNDDDVSGFRQWFELVDYIVGCRFVKSGFSARRDLCDDSFRVQSLALGNLLDAGNARKEDAMSMSKRLWQLVSGKPRAVWCLIAARRLPTNAISHSVRAGRPGFRESPWGDGRNRQ